MLNMGHNEILCFSELVPADLERELKNLYMSLCELLRHFWTSFPPTTTTLEAKAVRMHEALHRFHSARLKPFEVCCFETVRIKYYWHMGTMMTDFLHFNYWQFNSSALLSDYGWVGFHIQAPASKCSWLRAWHDTNKDSTFMQDFAM